MANPSKPNAPTGVYDTLAHELREVGRFVDGVFTGEIFASSAPERHEHEQLPHPRRESPVVNVRNVFRGAPRPDRREKRRDGASGAKAKTGETGRKQDAAADRDSPDDGADE